MRQRIKYREVDDGIVESVRIFRGRKNAPYRVTLDYNTKTFSIQNLNTGKKYKGGENITTDKSLRRAARNRLMKLGVKFTMEIRQRSNNDEELPKGEGTREANRRGGEGL